MIWTFFVLAKTLEYKQNLDAEFKQVWFVPLKIVLNVSRFKLLLNLNQFLADLRRGSNSVISDLVFTLHSSSCRYVKDNLATFSRIVLGITLLIFKKRRFGCRHLIPMFIGIPSCAYYADFKKYIYPSIQLIQSWNIKHLFLWLINKNCVMSLQHNLNYCVCIVYLVYMRVAGYYLGVYLGVCLFVSNKR